MNRRSFLALIAGAIAIKPERLLAKPTAKQVITTPFQIRDTAIVQPNMRVESRLFGLPSPKTFVVERVGLWFNPDCNYDDLTKVLDSVHLEMRLNKSYYLEGPIRMSMFCEQQTRLLLPIVVKNNHELDIKLNSSDVLELVKPVSIQVVLSGVVEYAV